MSSQPEGKLVKKMVDTLNAVPGCYCEKNHGTVFGHCKLDITGGINGRMFHIEAKMPGNKPTKRQDAVMRKWRSKAGVVTGWATSVEEALDIIKPLMEGT